MPKKEVFFRKRAVSSLFSLCTEYVAKNLQFYNKSLHFLPPHAKETMLRKFTRSNKFSNHAVNETLSSLIYASLKHINLSDIDVDDETLNLLRECPELVDIRLQNCDNHTFSSSGMMNLFMSTSRLLVVDVSRCQQFDDAVLECLSKNCRNLCELFVDGCNVTDTGLAFLAHFNKKIRCLTVSNTKITGDGISAAAKTKNWSSLQELRLDNCLKVNDDVLKIVIQNCPKIEILTFYNCAVTDETTIFQEITKNCKTLKQLHWTISW